MAAPTVESLKVTSVTPRDYTVTCALKDDTGIEKVVVLSWTDNESSEETVQQEILVEKNVKEAEVSADVAITDHGNARDIYYHTKVYVYDVRGNVTEYTGDEGKVYMPVLMHSSRKLILPTNLTAIGDEAFAGSIGFGEVIMPDGVTSIGTRAFAECSRLTLINIPDSVENIADNAFKDSGNVVLLCASNNAGAAYARENDIPYFTGE